VNGHIDSSHRRQLDPHPRVGRTIDEGVPAVTDTTTAEQASPARPVRRAFRSVASSRWEPSREVSA
jgi:hypothetical protein